MSDVVSIKLRDKMLQTVVRIRKSPIYPNVPSATRVIHDAIDYYSRHIQAMETQLDPDGDAGTPDA